MNQRENEEIEIDLVEVFWVLLNKIWILILAAALGMGIALAGTITLIEPQYSSTSMLYVLSKSTSITSLTDLQVGNSLTSDYMVFITSHPVVDTVIKELDMDITYEEFVDQVTVTNPDDTRFLYITVKYPDAYMSKVIVDKLTDVSVEYMEKIMETQRPNVLDYGHVPEKQTSPNPVKNAIAGAMAGMCLAGVFIVLLYLANDTIQTSEDVERYLGMNTLGVIPLEEGTTKKSTRGRDKDALRRSKQHRRGKKHEDKI